MKHTEKYAGFASLEDLRNAYLLLAYGESKKAAAGSDPAEKAGAGAEKEAQKEQSAARQTQAEQTPPATEKEAEEPAREQAPAREKEAEEGARQTPAEAPVLPDTAQIAGRVRAFLRAYPAALSLKERILAEIAADPRLGEQPDCLEIAMGRTLGRDYLPREALLKDEGFVRDFVMKDEGIKRRIIEEYLTALSGSMPPALIGGKGRMAALPPEKPASVSAAGQIFERMLKNRRI